MIWSLLTGRHLLKQLLEEMTDRDGLVVRSLVKHYGKKTAVDELSFSVEKGGIFALLGPNGAGKTTTMRILAGFVPPTSGSAQIAGHDVFFNSLEARRRIGYLPETVPLYNEMTVRGYLDYMSK